MRVVGPDGRQIGVVAIGEALNMARANGVDLVEIAPNADPPVCRLVDFGKYRYEQAKRDKEARKHQHANRVKEVQLTATIDPHDFSVKLSHAIEFLCEDMKVKATLRFRGREMAHKQYGFQVVERFVNALGPYGHPDAPARLQGRSVNVMVSPLPRNKRAPNPTKAPTTEETTDGSPTPSAGDLATPNPHPSSDTFSNNPFERLDEKVSSG